MPQCSFCYNFSQLVLEYVLYCILKYICRKFLVQCCIFQINVVTCNGNSSNLMVLVNQFWGQEKNLEIQRGLVINNISISCGNLNHIKPSALTTTYLKNAGLVKAVLGDYPFCTASGLSRHSRLQVKQYNHICIYDCMCEIKYKNMVEHVYTYIVLTLLGFLLPYIYSVLETRRTRLKCP